jgi:hypothetical protein
MPRRLHPLALLLLLAAAETGAAPPAGLVDPTRPPGAAPARAAASARAPAGSPAAELRQPPQLQAVQLARGGASTALVDGRLLRVGDRLGDAKVVGIDLQGLQLQGPRGTERLWLLAAVVQPPPPPPTPAPPTVAVAGDR